jgi:rhomboid protease GluP
MGLFDDEPDEVDEDDIPVLDASMLDNRIDFEKDMRWCPPVTIMVILACITAFGFEVANNALNDVRRLEDIGALSAPHVKQGEVWRMLSAPFLHASPDHVIGNMVMLFILGIACEHAFGSPQLLFLYVVAAIGGSCLSLTNAKISVGASGAIFGLAGALLGMFRRNRASLHVRDHRIGFVIGVWAAYTILFGFLSPIVDNMAHLGGFLTGVILGLGLPPALLHDREEFNRRPSVLIMMSVALMALFATSIWFIPRLLPK